MNRSVADPGSLDRLHDIVMPPPAPWWPPAPAWYVVGVIVGLAITWLGWRVVAHWMRDRYRRQALAELRRLEAAASEPATLPALAALVKRVALAAYPRERVASLSGEEWLAFLDATGREPPLFSAGPGRRLEDGYRPGTHCASPELFDVVRGWIKQHSRDLRC